MVKLKEFIKSIAVCDTFFALIMSVIVYVFSFKFLYWKIGYVNGVADFYTGTSIYRNVSKYSDILFIFLYIILFFGMLFIVKRCRNFDIKESISKMASALLCTVTVSSLISFINFVLMPLDFLSNNMSFILTILFCIFYLAGIKLEKLPVTFMQIVMLGGYAVMLPPKDLSSGTFWEGLLFALLISLSLFDILRRKNFSSIKLKISPLALAPFVVLLFGANYNAVIMSPDDHHFGEFISTFWSHDFFGAKYYKDIMLVHGYCDVLPMAAGKYIFANNTAEAFYMGSTLISNLFLIIIFCLLYFIFSGNLGFVIPSLFFPMESAFLIPSYLFLIKDRIFKHRYLFVFLMILCGILFSIYRTTLGSAWLFASIPAIAYSFYLIVKDKNYSKKSLALFLSLIIAVIAIFAGIFKEEIIGFFSKSVYYLKANLVVFGNYLSVKSGWISAAKLMQYIFMPVMILVMLKEFISGDKSDKNKQNLLFLSFAILYPMSLLSYSLGRVDGTELWRSYSISYQYLLLMLPFYLYLNKDRYQKPYIWLKRIFIAMSVVILLLQISLVNKMFVKRNQVQPIKSNAFKNLGSMQISDNKRDELESIYSVLSKYSKSDSDFLDLTNHGMLYFYMNKKMPMPFVSFYNVVSPELIDDYTETFKPENTRVIHISPVIRHDDVYVSLRIPQLYRKIILSQKYFVMEKDNNTYLIYDENGHKFSNSELNSIDTILGQTNLRKLPEVWAVSGRKLTDKLSQTDVNYSLKKEANTLQIKFSTDINGRTFDYIYLDFGKGLEAKAKINTSPTEVSFDSDSGKVLIPFDNIPSWLLTESLNTIDFCLNNVISNVSIKFYKRK